MWYSAKILFRSFIDSPTEGRSLSEESTRLIVANNEEEALARAELIGREEEHSYLNDEGDSVRWKFVEVMEIQDLCEEEISDGVEVYSKIYEAE